MNTKWKVLLSVMLLITIICTVFAMLALQQHNGKVAAIIKGKGESATLLAGTILNEFSNRYQDRIRAFTNPAVSASREKMIRAFADRDRDRLLQLSNPLFAVLKKETPYFSSLGWILPDNHVLLRLQDPEKFGDDVSRMRSDVVAVNLEKRQHSGFEAGYISMQYRIVQPVFYQNKYVGAVQFGIKASVIFDALQDKLHTIAGMAIVNTECDTVKKSKIPKVKCRAHTIRSRDAALFEPIKNELDWNMAQQRVVLNGKAHVIINALPVTNFQNDTLGAFFVALDISEELLQKRKLIITILLISSILLILSFLILYFSYESLIQKIIDLNQSLEKNNLELENRVQERTEKLQKSEKQLYRAQKMEAIGLMAGGVAHDLNNILSGIVGYPELLLQKLPEDSELRKPIEAIRESGGRAATVVEDLLTVARGAASTREVYNLNSLIQEYLDSPECSNLKSLHPSILCQHQFEAAQSNILCSPVHIKKCLMNLVINAAEAIGDNGSVVISTSNEFVDNVAGSQSNMEAGEYVVVSVRDTGSGISATDLEHIFEPFYTKKTMGRSGTGLGLAVVWNTMEDHGGRVLVESSDTGTCFKLYFPISEEERTIQTENETTENLTGNGEHILVVDDEPQLRDITSQLLRNMGYVVDSVCSGELALEFVKERPVDLIVMDMLMEPGMNGRQTYTEILKLYPDQKAVIISGYSESDDVKAALQLGAAAYIKKPCSMDQLSRTVRAVLAI